IYPEIEEIISIQKPISIINEEGDEVVGFIDFILKIKGIEGPIIFDLKSSGRKYEEHKLDTSDQLRIYAASENINNIGYIVLLKQLEKTRSCHSCGAIKVNARLKNCESCKKG